MRTGWARGGIAGALAAAVLAATGCTADSGDGDASGPAGGEEFHRYGELDWGACEDGPAGVECAVFDVPLDYGDPGRSRVEIAVKRLPATGDDPLGSLVVNPGGPGGSGYDYVDHAQHTVSPQVRERFDVVGFDPRGVGRSAPLRCLDAAGLDEFLGGEVDSRGGDGNLTEVTEAGLEQLEEDSRGFVEACRANAPDLMLHVGTVNVARDMDRLRALLGDDRLTYLGKSYGTQIGAHYADLFPDRVGALVLDGAVDPSQQQLEMSVEQATGFETALHAFVEDCLTLSECPLGERGESVEEGLDVLVGLLEQAGAEPLENRNGDGREVNRSRAELGVLAALYSEAYWPRVRLAIAEARAGDGTGLLELGDDLYRRSDPDGYENMTAALVAVNCSDSPSPRDIAAYAEAAEAAARESPVFGATLAWGALPCAYWPEEAVAEQRPMTAADADPILVVGTTRDSATPYEWSVRLAEQLESGVLLTRDGDGHTGYRAGNACVDAAVDAYLLERVPPADGTVCD